MNDVINRQAAIEDAKTWVAVDDHERRLKKDVIEWLKEFPLAQCKTGKWIDEGFYADGCGAHVFKCSECGGHIIEYDTDPFCKWCGADMRGEAE